MICQEEKMKHKKLFVRLLIPLLVLLALHSHFIIMTIRCAGTVVPDGLSPEEVIYQLETYWNSGNERGISLICSEDFNIAHGSLPYSFGEDKLRADVHITECSTVSPRLLANLSYLQLYDKHCYKVCWNKEESYEYDWRSYGFAFILIAKESDDENAQYKICKMLTGIL